MSVSEYNPLQVAYQYSNIGPYVRLGKRFFREYKRVRRGQGGSRTETNIFGPAGAFAKNPPAKKARVISQQNNNNMGTGTYSMTRRKVRDGKYLSKQRRLNHIVSNSADTVKEVWSKVSDPADASGSNRGAYWLDNGPTANGVTAVPITVLDTVTQTASVVTPKNLPVYVFDLGCTTQNAQPYVSNIARAAYRLAVTTESTGIGNQMIWVGRGAWGRLDTGPGVYPDENTWQYNIMDNEQAAGTNINVGRKAILDWVRIKALFYGKKSRPTYIKASIVYFLDDDLNPTYALNKTRYGPTPSSGVFGFTMPSDAQDYFRQFVRPLVANPAAVTDVLSNSRKMRVVATKVIKLAPKESIDSDADPHQQFVDWFHRFNDTLDYSFESTAAIDADDISQPNQFPTQNIGVNRCCLQYPKRNPFLMITSYQPEEFSTVPDVPLTNNLFASFDISIVKSTTCVS